MVESVRLIGSLFPLGFVFRPSQTELPPSAPGSLSLEPAFKRLVMFIFVGSRGGFNRVRIVELIKEEAMNPNKIAERLELDYKTVQHHLKLLRENGILVPSSPEGTYGAIYFLTPYVEKNLDAMRHIWGRFGQS